jgi:hypothetical protein
VEKVQAAIQKLKEKTSYTLERHATIILTDHQESFEETEDSHIIDDEQIHELVEEISLHEGTTVKS